MSSSEPPQPPPVAAVAATAAQEDEATLARKWRAMEQLTQIYGFPSDAASQAIETVGPDVEACCSFILDAGLGKDQGGPIVPKEDCPHLEQHYNFSVLRQLDASFDPHYTVCSHFQEESIDYGKFTGQAKADVDNETGSCPSKENWLCLECGVLRCSRYANGHGLQHWERTRAAGDKGTPKVGHCIGCSLSDLSVWCYVCGSYLKHPVLDPLLQKLEEVKFGRDDEQASNEHSKPAATE